MSRFTPTLTPTNTRTAQRSKSPDGGRNSPDGGRHWFTLRSKSPEPGGRTSPERHHWFTLFAKEKDEVRALEEATQLALQVKERPQPVPWIDETSSGSVWTVLAPGSMERDDVRVLVMILLDWVNDVLAERRVVVKDILDDFYDGQVLADLAEVLLDSGHLLGGIALTENGRRAKLRQVLEFFNDNLDLPPDEIAWSVNSILEKDVVSTLRLLVALMEHFAPQIRLPTGVCMEVIQVERTVEGIKSHSVIKRITSGVSRPAYSFDGYSYGDDPVEDEDVFDRLFNEAPEKVDAVKSVLVKFANMHLAKINVVINDMANDLRSGVVLLMLIQILANYFVPLHDYFVHPSTDDEHLRNVGLVVTLMDELGCLSAKAKEHILPDDVVSGDLKTGFRLLYSLFRKYKHAPVRGQSTTTV